MYFNSVQNILRLLFCLITLLLNLFHTTATSVKPPKEEIDSIRNEIKKCNTDTCVFNILKNQFWKYRFAGSEFSEFYGSWAFETIKNCESEKVLADGYDIKANLLMRENKNDSAAFYLQKALRISSKIGNTFRVAWSYYGLGEIESRKRNHRQAIDYFYRAELNFKKLNDFNYPQLTLNNYLADNYAKLEIYDSTFYYLEKNLAIEKRKDNRKSEIFTLLSISFYYSKLNNIKKSSEYLDKALEIAEKLNKKEILSSVYMQIGNSFYEQKKNYPASRNYYERALELIDTTDNGKMRANLYIQIGKTYLGEGRDSSGLAHILKSLSVAQKINYRHALSDSYENLGYAYKKMGNNKLALENFKKCWETQCDFCQPVYFHNALIEIADIHLKQHNFSEAFHWYEKSLELAEKANEKKEIALSKFNLGDYYSKKGEYSKAENFYLESFHIAKDIKNILLIRNIADTLNNFYSVRHNYEKAYAYLKEARSMEDSLFQIDKQSTMANLEMNFEFEKLKKENEAKELVNLSEIKKQKMYLIFLIIVSFLIASIGVVVFISFNRKKRDNLLLTEQKNEITFQKNELEKISRQLHEADQMKLNFFTNISHELRTPLTLIISPLLKLVKNIRYEELKDLFSLMLVNSKRLQSMINMLLDISKLDKGEIQLNKKMYNLNKHIRIIASMFQSLAEEKNIEFTVFEEKTDLFFLFDSERIVQVINNLLSNSFKYTPNAGIITLSYSLKTERLVEIKVYDTGIGIPEEDLGRVFDRFYQCKNTVSTSIEGSGIGLSLAKEFVELHGGTIEVQSELQKWTEFTVKLPFETDQGLCEEGYAPVIDENSYTEEDEKKNGKKTETILLIEDNKDLRLYLFQVLSVKYNVLLATNGEEGIKTAEKRSVDLIISDIMMPVLDGYQVTARIKENFETCHIPVILLTAKAAKESKLEGLCKGADDYIIKPFDEDELFLKIKNLFQNRKSMREKYRKQLSVNPSTVEVVSLDEQFLIQVTRIVEQEISNNKLDVGFICEKMNLSRPQVYRKIKALTGLSINQFIRSIRLKRAAELLKKKSGSISEIAYETGFESIPYFTTKFKEEFGKTPSEF